MPSRRLLAVALTPLFAAAGAFKINSREQASSFAGGLVQRDDSEALWWSPAVQVAAVFDPTGELLVGDGGGAETAQSPQFSRLESRATSKALAQQFLSFVQRDWISKDEVGKRQHQHPQQQQKVQAQVQHAPQHLLQQQAPAGVLPPVTPADHSWIAWLRLTLSFAMIVKAGCVSSNILWHASPIPLMKKITLERSTGDTDSAPLFSVAFGCFQWLWYGLFAYCMTRKPGFLVLVYSNILGSILGVYYNITFHYHCDNQAMRNRFRKYLTAFGFVVLLEVSSLLFLPALRALLLCGLISSLWGMIASCALLTTLDTVFQTRSSKTLPLELLCASTICSLSWIICGIMLQDPWILVPNCVGGTISSFALGLKWYFPEDASETTEGDEKVPLCASTASLSPSSDAAGHKELSSEGKRVPSTSKKFAAAPYGTLQSSSEEAFTGGTGEAPETS